MARNSGRRVRQRGVKRLMSYIKGGVGGNVSNGVRTVANKLLKKDPNIQSPKGMDADDWAEEGVWVSVKSSNVGAIQYYWENKALFVQFHSGAIYVYAPVPPQVAKAMFNAGSKGKFVWRRLRGKFPYGKIT